MFKFVLLNGTNGRTKKVVSDLGNGIVSVGVANEL
jgi:hypothetical protein